MLTRATLLGRDNVVAYCVYRSRYADEVCAVANAATSAGWRLGFWALDELVPVLTQYTVGQGTGSKFELCNRLASLVPPRNADTVVVLDDDVRFHRGSPSAFVGALRMAALDLGQPAHETNVNVSHSVTVRVPWHVARVSGFVEIGPIIAIAPTIRSRVLPFPDRIGMGWGLELAWAEMAAAGFLLGIVDLVSVDHLAPPGTTYDLDKERLVLAERLRDAGLERLDDVARVDARWMVWDAGPPWPVDRPAPDVGRAGG